MINFFLRIFLYLTIQWGLIYFINQLSGISIYECAFLFGILFFLYFSGLQWLNSKRPSKQKTMPIVDIIGGHVSTTDFSSDNSMTGKLKKTRLLPSFVSSIITLVLSILGSFIMY